jgi:formylglycine-generating enzyme required for sulfatase activity
MMESDQTMRRFLCAAILCLITAFAYAGDAEDVFWESVVKGNVQEEYELYLKQYPKGRYTGAARRIVEGMREKARGQQDAKKQKQAQVEAAKRAEEEAQRRDEEEARRRRAEAEAERQRAEQEAMRPGRVFRDCADCPEMVVIPAGSFMMGSPASESGRDDDEGPVHQVTLVRGFALGRTEVTVGEFRKFAQATGYKTEAENNVRVNGCRAFDASDLKLDWRAGRYWDNPGFTQSDAHPVACVSWNDARAYLEWISKKSGRSYRLPSEAQWEYAARGGTTASRYWGENPNDACRYANVADKTVAQGKKWINPHDCNDGHFFSAPVASYSPNVFGLYDMLGNVWEFVEDCWNGSYSGAPTDGSAWTSGNCTTVRMLRGGSWFGEGERFTRAAKRGSVPTTYRDDNNGFRVARTLP